MKLQNRNRALLLAIAGGYVIYLAYEMMRDMTVNYVPQLDDALWHDAGPSLFLLS